MAKCNICNVEILSESDLCPLCHAPLENKTGTEKDFFPKRGFVKSFLYYKIDRYFAGISFVAAFISILTEGFLSQWNIKYSYIVFAVLIDLFYWLRIRFYAQKFFSSQILSQTVLLSIIAASTYFALPDPKIIFEYILPCINIISFIAMLVYVFTYVKSPKKYILPLFALAIISIIPFGLHWIYKGSFIVLSALSACLGSLTIALILILGISRLLFELKKNFHI